MNIPFLKKYQPQKFNEFIIDKDYIEVLKTMINMDNLNILLIGNNGSGKTSLIEAIIREYYVTDKIPYKNVLVINNLRDQGIQYYRNEVKTFSQTRSYIKGKKKIIILDDIDLINEQSQQVFRNCIDKYSYNVHFLASCTNIQKVIDAVQSRCCIIKIKPFKKTLLNKIFNNIKKKENITIDKDAQELILNICNNSIRQLINYLEKFKILNINITSDLVQNVCTNISFYELKNYTNLCINNKIQAAITVIFNIFKKGYSVMDILDNYFIFIKNTNMIEEEIKYKIIKIICEYISIFHTIHENELELVLFTNDLIKILL